MQKRHSKMDSIYTLTRIILLIIIILYTILYFVTRRKQPAEIYRFNMWQLVLMAVFTYIPNLVEHIFKVNVPLYMGIAFMIFCVCHFILGEIAGFYATIKIWDSLLHSSTVVVLALVGVSTIYILNEEGKVKLIPIFLIIYPICFVMTIEVLWEMIEFSSDVILKTNMQRFNDSITGEPFIGQKALFDTMKDLIVDFIFATITSVIAYFNEKKGSISISKWILTKQEK